MQSHQCSCSESVLHRPQTARSPMHLAGLQWRTAGACQLPPGPCRCSAFTAPRHSRMGLLFQLRARSLDVSVHAAPPRRARPNTPRKELQKQSQVEYLKTFYENADRFEDGDVVYELTESSPRVRALQQKDTEQAQLNQQLAERISGLETWQQVRQLLLQHAADLNYLNVNLLAQRVGTLAEAQASEGDAAREEALTALAGLVMQRASWFQASLFAESAAGLAAAGHTDPAFWRDFTLAAERKLGSFTFGQLSTILEVLGRMGSVPSLNWLEKAYRQAGKHYTTATAAQLSDLLWAWGELGYTPNDRPFMNEMKNDIRRRFKRSEFDGRQLVRLMHGVARWAEYEPNERWLLAFAGQLYPYLGTLPADDVVEVLVSLVTLQYRPPDYWMEDCLARLSGTYLIQDSGAPSALPVDAATAVNDDDVAGAAAVGLLLSELGEGSARPQQQSEQGKQQQEQQGEEKEEQHQQQLVVEGAQHWGQQVEPAGGLMDVDGSDQHLHELEQAATSGREAFYLLDQDEELMSSLQQENSERDMANEALANRLASSLSASTSAPSSSQASGTGSDLAATGPGQALQNGRGSSTSSSGSGGELATSQLALLAWCFSTIDYTPKPAWMDFMEEQLYRQAPHMDIDNITDVMYGLAGMGHIPQPMLASRLLQRSGQLLPAMGPEPLSHTAIAVVHLQLQPDESWRQALLERTVQVMGACSLQQLADLLCAAAELGLQPAAAAMAAAAARAEATLPGAAPPELASLLWALARLGYKPAPQLLHAVLAALSLKLRFLGARSFADVAWALSCLRHRPGSKWLGEYLREAAAKASFMDDQSLVDALWALASFRAEVDGPWLAHMCEVLGQRAAGLGPANAAVALWALSQLGLQGQDMPPQLLAGLRAAMVAGQGPSGQQAGAVGGYAVQRAGDELRQPSSASLGNGRSGDSGRMAVPMRR